MSDIKPIPEAPRPPSYAGYGYEPWRPQRELQQLSIWVQEVEEYVREPEEAHMYSLMKEKPSYPMEGLEVIQMPRLTWQRVERESRAYRRMQPMFRRLLHFLEGQESVLRGTKGYHAYHKY